MKSCRPRNRKLEDEDENEGDEDSVAALTRCGLRLVHPNDSIETLSDRAPRIRRRAHRVRGEHVVLKIAPEASGQIARVLNAVNPAGRRVPPKRHTAGAVRRHAEGGRYARRRDSFRSG